jgi:hypothetical protein
MVIGERWRAGIGEIAGGVEADEIGGVGAVERHDPAMRAGNNEREDHQLAD